MLLERGRDPKETPKKKVQGGRKPRRFRAPSPKGLPIPPSRPMRTLAFWVLFTLIAVIVFQYFSVGRPREQEISFSKFVQEINHSNIKSVVIGGKKIKGDLRSESAVDVEGKSVKFTNFVAWIPFEDPQLPQRILDKNPDANVTSKPSGVNWGSIVFSALPAILLLVFWVFLIRQMQSGGSTALKFGKSRATLLVEDRPKVTFEDVAGADEAKQELQEIIEFLKDPRKFQTLGGRIPKGALLLGPPGTGKTLLAKAVAGEAEVPFFSMSGSDFVEMFVGVGASVTGDTPVVVRTDRGVQLTEIGRFIDSYYQGETEGNVVYVNGIQTLGFAEKDSKFTGSAKRFFGHSQWVGIKGVYRHRVTEICEIHYLGGVISTTADHSVFVRTRNGVHPKAARDLKPGDVLVVLPIKVRNEYLPVVGTTHSVRGHQFVSVDEPISVDVWEGDPAAEKKYSFAMAQGETMSQYAIASAIGVSQATVGHWQSGKHMPRALSRNYTDVELPEALKVTPGLMKLLGYYTAEGHCNNCLEFVFGAHEIALHADCISLMREVFGLEAAIEFTTDNSARFRYGSAVLGRFFAHQCGNDSHNKHIPDMLWDLPREYFEAYLSGYAHGDGYTTKEGKLSMTTVSQQLVRELTWLCAMHGVAQGKKPYVRKVVVKPYDGYVYDFCGCDNEAFFGGEKPVLLHNSRVRDLFDQGKKNAPCIIFIDEIDAVGRHRGAGLGGGHDEREQTLNQLLVEMDGFESNDGVILIAATNRPDVLDPALLRPGRFDRQIVVDRPDVRGREGILKVHSRKIPLDDDVDMKILARGTPGLAGADLANLVNEAALLAARRNRKKAMMQDFEDAKDKVMMGTERKSLIISDEEKRSTAYHESGHALVASLQPGSDPIHKVTIIPRGRALGLTHLLPVDERYTRSRDYLMRTLATLMGGRSAEQLVLKQFTTGASNDIESATEIARKMVCEWGMSEKLGPLSFGKRDELIFLGREISQHKDYSEKTAMTIDEEVRAIVETASEQATKLLSENIDKLHRLAAALLEREILDGEETLKIIRGEEIAPLSNTKEKQPSEWKSQEPPHPSSA
ncbi:MAG: ATP-dependent metallopeptidase FtsH/Yme1/Tma family protein [Candidatus Eisenbacteria bacterium]|nr:ATP-dependent metallopeptidase FtsH/Yme1/Tma family protein [Candidatus Eisenbacteria bacterium]